MVLLSDEPRNASTGVDGAGCTLDRKDPALSYRQARNAHWDTQATESDDGVTWGDHYRRRLTDIYQFLVAPGQRVLEIGCGRGDLLAALSPAVGVGVDFSEAMVQVAARRYPALQFVH